MTTPRFRLRYTFWLDLHKADEHQLADQIAILKDNRTFAKTIRDGIRLILDLRAGRTDVLLELFPLIRTTLAPPHLSDQQKLLDQLEQLLLQATNRESTPAAAPRLSNEGTGPKALSVPKFEVPTFDDDDLDTLVIQRDTTTNSTQNFLNSLMNLQQ